MTPNAAALAHDELRELLGLYALDALPPEERAVVHAHLTGCADCRAEVAALGTAVAALPLLLDEMESPPALRGRIAAAIQPAPVVANPAAVETWPAPVAAPSPVSAPQPATVPRQPPSIPVPTPIRPVPAHRPFVPWAAAALLLAASLGMLGWNLRLQDEASRTAAEVVDLRDQASRAAGQVDALRDEVNRAAGKIVVLRIEASRAEDQVVALRQEVNRSPEEVVGLVPREAAPAASGEVFLPPTQDLIVLDVEGLPPLAPGEVYQVWLIGAEGAPVPSGVFAGTAARHAVAADPAAYQTLAITAEPGPLGSTGPTGEIVATASLEG